MRKLILAASCVLAAVVGGSGNAVAQGRPDSQALLAAQRKALARLAFMDGVWRGPAWTGLPSGEKRAVTSPPFRNVELVAVILSGPAETRSRSAAVGVGEARDAQLVNDGDPGRGVVGPR